MEKPATYINPQYKAKRASFSLRSVPSLIWLMFLVIGLAIVGEMGAMLAWGIIAIWVLKGVDEAIEGLLLALLLVFLNPELNNSGDIASVARWGIIAEATLRIAFAWWKTPQKWPSWSKFLILFIIYTTFTSFVVSWWPIASLTKLVTFSVVVLMTYFGIKLSKKDWQQNLIIFGVVITLLSLPLIALPLGYVRNGHQFQGILNHPQSYGVILSILMAVAIGRWLLTPGKKASLWQFILLILMGTTVILSGARTGYFALILAVFSTLLFARSSRGIFKRLLFNPFTYFLLAITIAYVGMTQPIEQFKQLIFERDVSDYAYYDVSIDTNPSTLSYLLASRSGLIARSWGNFLKNPWFGAGFGLPSIRIARDTVATLAGIPVSIPYEKGFTGTAVLEEVGIIGALLILGLLISQFRVIHKSQAISAMLIFLTAIFVNMGESVYFATGGIGLLVHIAIAVALVTAERRTTAIEAQTTAAMTADRKRR